MEQRIRPTRSGLFAIELLIAIGVFSVCAAVCVGIYTKSEVMSRDSQALNCAVAAARNAAECYKAAGGDLIKTAELCGGSVRGGQLELAFDGQWRILPGDSDAAPDFLLTLTGAQEGDFYSTAWVTVQRESNGGRMLLRWELAAFKEAAA